MLSYDSEEEFAWGLGHTEGQSRAEVLKPQRGGPDTTQLEAAGSSQDYLTEKPRHRGRLGHDLMQ